MVLRPFLSVMRVLNKPALIRVLNKPSIRVDRLGFSPHSQPRSEASGARDR